MYDNESVCKVGWKSPTPKSEVNGNECYGGWIWLVYFIFYFIHVDMFVQEVLEGRTRQQWKARLPYYLARQERRLHLLNVQLNVSCNRCNVIFLSFFSSSKVVLCLHSYLAPILSTGKSLQVIKVYKNILLCKFYIVHDILCLGLLF